MSVANRAVPPVTMTSVARLSTLRGRLDRPEGRARGAAISALPVPMPAGSLPAALPGSAAASSCPASLATSNGASERTSMTESKPHRGGGEEVAHSRVRPS